MRGGGQHTPGPWDIAEYEGLFVTASQPYKYVCDVVITHPAYAAPELVISKAEALANARLIAAAPDLLFALENLLVDKHGKGGPSRTGKKRCANQAIAKAKGT